MKGIMKKTITMLLLIVMVFSLSFNCAMANTPGGTGNPPEGYDITASWKVSGYTLYEAGHCGDPKYMLTGVNAVKYGSKGASPIDAIVDLKYTGKFTGIPNVSVTRGVDSFNGGTILGFVNGAMSDAAYGTTGTINFITKDDNNDILSIITNRLKNHSGISTYSSYKCCITDLKYKGVGNSLSLIINTDGEYQDIDVDIVELKEYEAPEATAEPYALFTIGKMPSTIKENDVFDLTINIKNKGKADMTGPIATVVLSDSLMNMSGQDSFEVSDIAAGATGAVTMKVKALSKISSEAQTATVNLEFDYSDGSKTAHGTTDGKVTIPCVMSEELTEEGKIASPVPNVIVEAFSYGSKSVAASSEFNFDFTFKNTSKKLNVENMLVTVESAGFTPNGASNSFYFSQLGAGKEKSISIPMKANNIFQSTTEDITITFNYEYVDNKTRHTNTNDYKISVPVYQKDRFEITAPVVPGICYEGEEISVMMDYANKGKSAANNVEAKVEGDVTAAVANQIIGNIESGRNGQFAFAITPNSVGECKFTITVSYEDANENQKERVFPVTLNVEAAAWEDPGQWEDPGMEPEPEKNNNLWKYIAIAAAIALVVLLVVLKKRKKAKAAKQEANQWQAWEEEFAKEEASAEANSASDEDSKKEKAEADK